MTDSSGWKLERIIILGSEVRLCAGEITMVDSEAMAEMADVTQFCMVLVLKIGTKFDNQTLARCVSQHPPSHPSGVRTTGFGMLVKALLGPTDLWQPIPVDPNVTDCHESPRVNSEGPTGGRVTTDPNGSRAGA